MLYFFLVTDSQSTAIPTLSAVPLTSISPNRHESTAQTTSPTTVVSTSESTSVPAIVSTSGGGTSVIPSVGQRL